MRILFAVVFCLASLASAPPPASADDGREAIPVYLASFESTRSAGIALSAPAERAAWQASLETRPELPAWNDEPSSGSKGTYLPVLYSLLIPGTGEIALGYPKRGVVLIALEVTAWVGYAHYRNEGLDGRAAFEAFADAHWTEDRWIFNHPVVEGLPADQRTFEAVDSLGQCCWSGWPGYHSWAAKDDVKLNYYENIGKYDWFISGWEDWDPVSKPMNTSLRDQYRALRKQSNDDLDTADKFIYLSVATRVFSLVETIILARQNAKASESDSEAVNQRNYSFKTRSTGVASGEVAFIYRF